MGKLMILTNRNGGKIGIYWDIMGYNGDISGGIITHLRVGPRLFATSKRMNYNDLTVLPH